MKGKNPGKTFRAVKKKNKFQTSRDGYCYANITADDFEKKNQFERRIKARLWRGGLKGKFFKTFIANIEVSLSAFFLSCRIFFIVAKQKSFFSFFFAEVVR